MLRRLTLPHCSVAEVDLPRFLATKGERLLAGALADNCRRLAKRAI